MKRANKKMAVRKIFVVLTISSIFYSVTSEPIFCGKTDFDKYSYEDYQTCAGQHDNVFVSAPYVNSGGVPLYKDKSTYFLSTKVQNSCVESKKTFSIDDKTRIEAAVYLNGTASYARIEISIYNDQNIKVHTWVKDAIGKIEKWSIMQGEAKEKLTNAKVKLFACAE